MYLPYISTISPLCVSLHVSTISPPASPQVGLELRGQMHAYAAHYARQMWPGTAKKMGMGERHLVVHYRVGDVAVGPVLAPGSVVAAIKALSPPPRVVEILSGGVKHDTECAEAMEAYLERIKVTRTLARTLTPTLPLPYPYPTPYP